MQLSDLGWHSFFDNQVTNEERADRTAARVVWEGRGGYRVSFGEHEWRAEPSGRLRHQAASRADLPTTGDWVIVTAQPVDDRAQNGCVTILDHGTSAHFRKPPLAATVRS